MIYLAGSHIITLIIFLFFLKNEKFYPAMAKFYWTLAIIFVPFAWIIYLVWGRKYYSFKNRGY
jgi:hypothetical protein